MTFDLSLTGFQKSQCTTNATFRHVTLSPDLDQLSYYVLFDGIPLWQVRISMSHCRNEWTVVLDLSTQLLANTISGNATISLKVSIHFEFGFYINIHTATNPDGEIRVDSKFAREALLLKEGGQEVPPVTTRERCWCSDHRSRPGQCTFMGCTADLKGFHRFTFHNGAPVWWACHFDLTGESMPSAVHRLLDSESNPVFTAQ